LKNLRRKFHDLAEVTHIRDEYGDFHDVPETGTTSHECTLEIGKRLLALRPEATLHDSAVARHIRLVQIEEQFIYSNALRQEKGSVWVRLSLDLLQVIGDSLWRTPNAARADSASDQDIGSAP
jgi:hypothetical protein